MGSSGAVHWAGTLWYTQSVSWGPAVHLVLLPEMLSFGTLFLCRIPLSLLYSAIYAKLVFANVSGPIQYLLEF